MISETAPKGKNVQQVREAIDKMRQGTGNFAAVIDAVRQAEFVPTHAARSMDELADQWDYAPVEDSFTDTVSVAQWQRVLTREQVRELKGLAKFVTPGPETQKES